MKLILSNNKRACELHLHACVQESATISTGLGSSCAFSAGPWHASTTNKSVRFRVRVLFAAGLSN